MKLAAILPSRACVFCVRVAVAFFFSFFFKRVLCVCMMCTYTCLCFLPPDKAGFETFNFCTKAAGGQWRFCVASTRTGVCATTERCIFARLQLYPRKIRLSEIRVYELGLFMAIKTLQKTEEKQHLENCHFTEMRFLVHEAAFTSWLLCNCKAFAKFLSDMSGVLKAFVFLC